MRNVIRCFKIVFTVLLLFPVFTIKGQAQEIDLSGEWAFQTDVMDFRRGSLSPRYKHKLQEKNYFARYYRRLSDWL